MPLSIKNDATERLARQVADETGESLTQAIQKALEERWERLKTRRRSHVLNSQLEESVCGEWTLFLLSTPGPKNEILGYDEHGMPR